MRYALLLLLTLTACKDTETQDSAPADTSPADTQDTEPQDTGETLSDGDLFYGLWKLVHVDDTDGSDEYPKEELESGCWITTSFTLNVNTDLSGTFEQIRLRECPGQDPDSESFTYEMKGAYIIDREFTIRIKDWELALTCIIPDDDPDRVSCAGVDDSGPLVLDFVRARD